MIEGRPSFDAQMMYAIVVGVFDVLMRLWCIARAFEFALARCYEYDWFFMMKVQINKSAANTR